MATVEEVARDLLASVDTDAGFLNAITWVNDRYMELCNLYPMSHLRSTASVSLTTGTVKYGVATDVLFWGSVTYISSGSTPTRRLVHRVSLQELDDFHSTRTASSSTAGPYVYADTGWESSNKRELEIWPSPAGSSGSLTVNYYAKPTTLSISSTLPNTVDKHVLREGALIDLYRYMAAKASMKGDAESARHFSELAVRQEGVWKDVMVQASKADRGRIHWDTPLRYPET